MKGLLRTKLQYCPCINYYPPPHKFDSQTFKLTLYYTNTLFDIFVIVAIFLNAYLNGNWPKSAQQVPWPQANLPSYLSNPVLRNIALRKHHNKRLVNFTIKWFFLS